MSTMKLPFFLRPKNNYKLKRLGKNYDGGYLTCVNSIKNSDILISLGIYDDWSFEKHFNFDNKKIEIFMFDQTLSFFFLLKRFIVELIKLLIPGRIKNLKYTSKNIFDYFLFVNKKFTKMRINKYNFAKIINTKKKKKYIFEN